ncbi:hypothetical protein Goarm_006443, partial [Gossypium armourianum]|nr:hypothetical protein [Gossypium armourianum]
MCYWEFVCYLVPFDADHPLNTYVTGCLALINEGWVMEICHILREGNKCANHLVNLAQESSDELVVLIDL